MQQLPLSFFQPWLELSQPLVFVSSSFLGPSLTALVEQLRQVKMVFLPSLARLFELLSAFMLSKLPSLR